MAEIRAKVVMDLRGRTGCGMMDCKKALAACDGDIEKAIDYLREKGLAKAAKKQSRIAAEGCVGAYICNKCNTGALVEVNCETDFVANTPEFKEMVNTIAKQIVISDPIDVDVLLTTKLEGSEQTVGDMITEKTAKIGEKISVRRFVRYAATNGTVDSYIHMGGKVGVLVEVNCETDFVARGDQFKELVHDIALQIAAAKPLYVTKEEVPAEVLEEEKKILKIQAMNEGKPEAIAEKMVAGRIKKYYEDFCLLEQPFVKDSSKTINQLITEAIASIGEKITVRRFARFEMGEGIEKKKDDLAEEVEKQVSKMKG